MSPRQALFVAPSQYVLKRTPAKVLKFLLGVARDPVIRAELLTRGYTKEEHALGWKRLYRVGGAVAEGESEGTAVRGEGVPEALTQINDWVALLFKILPSALRRSHKAQANYLFADVAPGTGAAAVIAAGILLKRLDAMDNGTRSRTSKKTDAAAMETVTARGITREDRKRIHGLLQMIEAGEAPATGIAEPVDTTTNDLTALWEWLEDWSSTARTVLTSRQQLIALGLAERRASGTKIVKAAPKPTTSAPTTTATTPPPAAAVPENGAHPPLVPNTTSN